MAHLLWIGVVFLLAYTAGNILQEKFIREPCTWHVWQYIEGQYKCDKCGKKAVDSGK